MPELPDVQVFRDYMNATALHQEIRRTSVKDESLLRETSARGLARRLKGRPFERTHRHGKHLFTRIADDGWLRLHFGMTGFLTYYRDEAPRSEHVRLRIDFANDYRLDYDCQRRFGQIGLVDEPGRFVRDHGLGPDPLEPEFDYPRFRERLERRGSVKSALMNQSVLAGLGNIYSDEILFQAAVHPAAKLDRLSEARLRRVFRSMNHVVSTAIERRVDPERFPRSWLTPRRGRTDRCPRCRGTLDSVTIAGRTSYFCDRHQTR